MIQGPFHQPLWIYLSGLPPLVLYCVGLALSVKYRKSNPLASRFVTIGFSLMIFEWFFDISIGAWLRAQPVPPSSGAFNFAILGLLISSVPVLLDLSGWVLLILGMRKLFKQNQERPLPSA